MPTPSGRLTAQERRDIERERHADAVRELESRIVTPEWLAEQVAAYPGTARVAFGDTVHFEMWFPAGERVRIGREEVDEGKARSWAVARALGALGYDPHTMMSIGMFQGRSGLKYGLSEYRKAAA